MTRIASITLITALALAAPGCRDRSREGDLSREVGGAVPTDELSAMPEEEELDEEFGEIGFGPGGGGTKMALEEGKMGKQDSERESGQYALEAPAMSPKRALERAKDEAKKSGIAGALRGDAFADATGTDDAPGGGVEVGPVTRAWFPETFLFEPLVVTDESGDADVDVKVPDRLTRWRVLALAHSRTGAQAGAVTSFAGTIPAYVDPVLPPFLHAGDTVRLPVQLVNTTDAAIPTQLELEATGATLTGGSGAVTIPAQSTVVRHATVTTATPGTLRLQARLGAADAIVRELPIEPTGKPVTQTATGTLAAPRTLTLTSPSKADPRLDRVMVQVFPGALAILRSELRAATGRRGIADDSFALLLSGRAPELLAALGDQPDPATLRDLTVILTQRAVGYARRLDLVEATLLAEAAASHPDSPVLAAIATRAEQYLVSAQHPDGTCGGEDGWTLQRLLVTTADCARASASQPSVAIRAAGAFERHADQIEDPYTAAAVLASGAATSSALAEKLQKQVLGAIDTADNGAKFVVVPADVVRADGARPSRVEATALAILALEKVAGAPLADLGATLLAGYSPRWGWGDGRANLVAMQALVRLFRDPLPDKIRIALAMDGAEVASGELDRDRIREILTLEAPGGAGAHEWQLSAEPPVAGLGFALTLTSWVPWPEAEASQGLELQITPPAQLQVGRTAELMVRAVAPSGQEVVIEQSLPAGVQADRAALDAMVSGGQVSRYELPDGQVVLHLPPPAPAQMITLRIPVVPTLAGQLQTGASSISVGHVEVLVPPSRWTIRQ